MRRKVVVVLPAIRSTHNTGSFFRTADALGISKIFLCTFTAIPPHPHLLKVSLGAETTVPWEYVEDPKDVVKRLRADGFQLVGVEQTEKSIPLDTIEWKDNVALFFGHEVEGLAQELIELMDECVEIPMQGEKESLNVSVTGGIVMYEATRSNS